MPSGTVKWFNNAKGYGFILPDEGGEDLFVHYTSILMDGYKTLKAGQIVQFEIVEGGKGFHATNIRLPHSPSPPASASASAKEDKPSSDSTSEQSAEQSSQASSDSEQKAKTASGSELETIS